MTITLLAGVTSATGQQLDDNWIAVSNQAPIPCSVSGSNTIALTQKSNVYTVTVYGNNMQFSGVAAGTNTTAATAQLGSLGALSVYKDSLAGPVVLAGGEIVSGNAFTLLYDATLNSGAGGFHLFTTTGNTASPINPLTIRLGTGSTLSRYLTTTASMSFTVFAANSSQEQNVALSGVSINDTIQVGMPSMSNQAISYFGYVPAAGTVTVRAVSAAAATLAAATGLMRVTGMG